MDLQFDESWCPVCDRQIMPKRYLVPIQQPQAPAPSAPPSSPSSSPSKQQQTGTITSRQTRTKNNGARTKGGLLQGTGRVKPNGTIKRADSRDKTSPPSPQEPAPKPAVPIKHRTVIDQGPIPLYCSDECRMADISRLDGALQLDYNPDRQSPPLPPVPHNSVTGLSLDAESDSTSNTGSSVDSDSSAEERLLSRSMATLAAMYDFPPLPPAPILSAVASTSSSDSDPSNDYQSGIMMAARRITAALCPDTSSKRKTSPYQSPHPRQPIPGWTDGSDAWRSSVYSLSAAHENTTKVCTIKAYGSFSASPHRSQGVYSTVGESQSVTPTVRQHSTTSLPAQRPEHSLPSRSGASNTEELYAKYSESFTRRSHSRNAAFPSSSHSLPSMASTQRRREVPILKPGAEGRLLVPNVKMRVHTGSSLSLSSCDGASTGSWRTGSSYPASSRPSVRSPLSRFPSEISEDSMISEERDRTPASLPPTHRPAVQTRSWSYDNLKTYTVPMLPPKKEKRIQRQVVDGEVQEIEIEVEVTQPLKRLFLFAGKEIR